MKQNCKINYHKYFGYEKNKEINSFLLDFLNQKANSYVEPQRKGTPKGKAIGFSRLKYLASLYILTNTKQKEIASSLKINYGTLRNWNREIKFRDVMDEHIDEFSNLVFEHIYNKIDKFVEAERKYFDGVADKEPPEPQWPEFADTNNYSGILLGDFRSRSVIYIREKILKTKGCRNNVMDELGRFFRDTHIEPFEAIKFLLMLEVVNFHILRLKPKTISLEIPKMEKEMCEKVLSHCRQIISKDKITKKDKKQISILLETFGALFIE